MLNAHKKTTSRAPRHFGQKGFSLVEIVMTMSIVAILMSISIFSAWNLLPNIRLKTAGRELFGNMQKARLLSIKNRTPVAIVFDHTNNTYTLYTSPGTDGSWLTPGDNTAQYTVTLADYKSNIAYGHGSLPAGTEIGSTYGDDITYVLGPSQNVLQFKPIGTAHRGYVYLDHLERDDNVIAIGTDNSGKVMLRRRIRGAWK